MHSCISHNLYPDEFLQPELLHFWSRNRELVVHTLLHGKNDLRKKATNFPRNLFVYPSDDLIKEIKLRANKSKGNVAGNSGPTYKPGNIQWLNIPLEAGDVNALERDESTLEYLAAALVGLAGDGYGISVKYNVERKSYNCSIYRSDFGDGRSGMGISGFASDVRDALLVTLYKFDNKLGGEFPAGSDASAFMAATRRFG